MRPDGAETALKAGSTALIFDYDADGEFFWVMPYDADLDPHRSTLKTHSPQEGPLMDSLVIGIGVLIAAVLLIVVGIAFMLRLFRKVDQGQALIVSKIQEVDVTFTGAIVLPVLHKAEVMDISVKTIEIARTGNEGLICHDNIRADIRITFFVRVNKTVEDVLKVAQAIGTDAGQPRGDAAEAVQREVLRGAEDRRQAAGLRRPVHAPRSSSRTRSSRSSAPT